VDDAKEIDQDKEAALAILKEMEDITEKGGSRIKETVMSGDLVEKLGELRKVLVQ
jgi:hypothetical protein